MLLMIVGGLMLIIKPPREMGITTKSIDAGWDNKPRSVLWKLIASLIWIAACALLFYLWIHHGLSIDAMPRGPEQDKAAFDFVRMTVAVMLVTFTGMIDSGGDICMQAAWLEMSKAGPPRWSAALDPAHRVWPGTTSSDA